MVLRFDEFELVDSLKGQGPADAAFGVQLYSEFFLANDVLSMIGWALMQKESVCRGSARFGLLGRERMAIFNSLQYYIYKLAVITNPKNPTQVKILT